MKFYGAFVTFFVLVLFFNPAGRQGGRKMNVLLYCSHLSCFFLCLYILVVVEEAKTRTEFDCVEGKFST